MSEWVGRCTVGEVMGGDGDGGSGGGGEEQIDRSTDR